MAALCRLPGPREAASAGGRAAGMPTDGRERRPGGGAPSDRHADPLSALMGRARSGRCREGQGRVQDADCRWTSYRAPEPCHQCAQACPAPRRTGPLWTGARGGERWVELGQIWHRAQTGTVVPRPRDRLGVLDRAGRLQQRRDFGITDVVLAECATCGTIEARGARPPRHGEQAGREPRPGSARRSAASSAPADRATAPEPSAGSRPPSACRRADPVPSAASRRAPGHRRDRWSRTAPVTRVRGPARLPHPDRQLQRLPAPSGPGRHRARLLADRHLPHLPVRPRLRDRLGMSVGQRLQEHRRRAVRHADPGAPGAHSSAPKSRFTAHLPRTAAQPPGHGTLRVWAAVQGCERGLSCPAGTRRPSLRSFRGIPKGPSRQSTRSSTPVMDGMHRIGDDPFVRGSGPGLPRGASGAARSARDAGIRRASGRVAVGHGHGAGASGRRSRTRAWDAFGWSRAVTASGAGVAIAPTGVVCTGLSPMRCVAASSPLGMCAAAAPGAAQGMRRRPFGGAPPTPKMPADRGLVRTPPVRPAARRDGGRDDGDRLRVALRPDRGRPDGPCDAPGAPAPLHRTPLNRHCDPAARGGAGGTPRRISVSGRKGRTALRHGRDRAGSNARSPPRHRARPRPR